MIHALLMLGLLTSTVGGAALAPAAPVAAQGSPTPALTLEPFVGGLDAPDAIANAGDGSGRLFVVERPGRIRVIVDGELLDEPFLDITDRVHTDDSEQGLLGLVFHPDFESNGYLFVMYTANDWANTVERFHSPPGANRADTSSGRVLIAQPDREPNHNSGALAFGPDGYLYIGMGDEGSGGDPYGNAQDLSTLFGKILRIDVDSGAPYAVPPDNPFVSTAGARAEIWTFGLRNPWRITFDRVTGDLFIADVGQNSWEEVNVQPANSTGGQNYGWNVMEGAHCFLVDEGCESAGFVMPIAEYDHDAGCSITGGYRYRGAAEPSLTGLYLFGDYCSGRIWATRHELDGGWTTTALLDSDYAISTFGEDERGELYVADLAGGALYRVTATGDNPRPMVTTLAPEAVAPGSADLVLTVTGDYFVDGADVEADGQPLATTFVNSTVLTAILPASALTSARAIGVTVVNPEPGALRSNEASFTVGEAAISEPAFQRTWARTDQPVATGDALRTWMWAPGPFTSTLREAYDESPGNLRAVQYFDKSRMEITDPSADATSPWYVTNGLLVVELMSGRMQVGHDAFEAHEPAAVNVAGDPDDQGGPTYATLSALRAALALPDGAPITQRLARDGTVTDDATLARFGVTAAARVHVPGIDHQVASVFWAFMTSSGPVLVDGQLANAPLFENPFYATGLPITEAYWTTVAVGGVARDVLLQCFERRCLTYTPDNPAGWQVEAGNVGRHYYLWRYGT